MNYLLNIIIMKSIPYIFLLLINTIVSAQDFDWATRAGGNDSDDLLGLVTDDTGNIYVTGYFKNTAHFGEGGNQVSLTSMGGADIFFAKYNPSGDLIGLNGPEVPRASIGEMPLPSTPRII